MTGCHQNYPLSTTKRLIFAANVRYGLSAQSVDATLAFKSRSARVSKPKVSRDRSLSCQATRLSCEERAFSFNIAGNSSFLNDSSRAGFAIDFCQHVVYIVAVVFCLASLRKLRRYCWSGAKRNYNSRRSEHRFHGGSLFQGHPLLRLCQLA